jgi:hypothetical protein
VKSAFVLFLIIIGGIFLVSCKKVVKPLDISVNKISTLELGNTHQLIVSSLTPKANLSVDYVSSDPSIASISDTGLISSHKIGKVTIDVVSKVNSDVSDYFALTVTYDLGTWTASISSIVQIDKTVTVKVTANLPEGRNVSDFFDFSVNNNNASVNELGVVTGLVVGRCVITVTLRNEARTTRNLNLEIALVYNEPLVVIKPTELVLGNTFQLEVTNDDMITDLDEKLNFTSNNVSVASVSSTGLITAIGIGQTYIRISSKENPGQEYNFLLTVISTHVEFITNFENDFNKVIKNQISVTSFYSIYKDIAFGYFSPSYLSLEAFQSYITTLKTQTDIWTLDKTVETLSLSDFFSQLEIDSIPSKYKNLSLIKVNVYSGKTTPYTKLVFGFVVGDFDSQSYIVLSRDQDSFPKTIDEVVKSTISTIYKGIDPSVFVITKNLSSSYFYEYAVFNDVYLEGNITYFYSTVSFIYSMVDQLFGFIVFENAVGIYEVKAFFPLTSGTKAVFTALSDHILTFVSVLEVSTYPTSSLYFEDNQLLNISSWINVTTYLVTFNGVSFYYVLGREESLMGSDVYYISIEQSKLLINDPREYIFLIGTQGSTIYFDIGIEELNLEEFLELDVIEELESNYSNLQLLKITYTSTQDSEPSIQIVLYGLQDGFYWMATQPLDLFIIPVDDILDLVTYP